MRTSKLTALLALAALATTAGCGSDKKKTDKADAATTSAQTTTATTASTTPSKSSTASTTPAATDGGASDAEPGRVVQEYFNALSKRDSTGACVYMGDEMKRAAVNFVRSALKTTSVTCADAIDKILKPQKPAALAKARNLEILSSKVKGNFATVKVKGALRNALLTKRGGRWLITGGIFTTP
jgi:hypothetical protein